MRMLVTNDDGINAAGIRALAEYLSSLGEVYVVAPAEQQSAKSQSVTFLTEVIVQETEVPGAAKAYSLAGTPTDCVNWAISAFRRSGIEFDYVFSGINLGANIGLANYYSGTIAAAREGALQGVRSIALSVGTLSASEFDYILSAIPELMKMSDSLSPATFLSVNAPNLPANEIKGLKVAEVAPWGYGDKYVFDKVGRRRYQLNLYRRDPGATELRYDFDWYFKGYTVVSPITTHASDDDALRILNNGFGG